MDVLEIITILIKLMSIVMINHSISFLMLAFLSLSCTSKNQKDLQMVLQKNDQELKNILLGKDSPEELKINSLIHHDYLIALKAIDEQEIRFNSLIDRIDSTKQGSEHEEILKKHAIAYYTAQKHLHLFERAVITQLKVSRQSNQTELVSKALDSLLVLQLQKQKLYQAVFESEKVFYNSRKHY